MRFSIAKLPKRLGRRHLTVRSIFVAADRSGGHAPFAKPKWPDPCAFLSTPPFFLRLGRNPLLSRRRCGLALSLHLSALPVYAPLLAFRILARGLGKQQCNQWARARGERKAKSLPGD